MGNRLKKAGLVCTAAIVLGAIIYGVVGATIVGAAPRPSRISPEMLNTDRTSTVRIPVSGSLSYLAEILNAEVPQRLTTINQPKQICLKTKSKLLPDISCRLKGFVDRGRITLSGSGKTMTIAIPVNLRVEVLDIGDIIKRETVTGAMQVLMRVQPQLSRDWRTTATVDIEYRWTDEIGIDALGQRITFGSRIEPEIRKVAKKIEQRLPQLIQSLNARQKVESIWHAGFTVERAKSDPEIWVRFTPQEIGMADYVFRDGQLIVDLAVQAQTETIFGPEPEKPEKTPLPDLMEQPPARGINVQVPVYIPYDVFEKPLTDIVGMGEYRQVTLEDGTTTEARFNSIEIFGTEGGRLAIGLDVSIKSPVPLINEVEGEIWVVAKPKLDVAAKTIGISDLEVISQTDSTAFNLLAGAISAAEIDEELIAQIRYDFSDHYQEGLVKADEWLAAEPLEGFVFNGSLEGADLKELHVAPDGMVIEVWARGKGRLHYAPAEADGLVAARRARRVKREAEKAAAANAAD
ncbi:DUF4403 family protein [Alterisphingorhabdus coralli]|uniref:DUF4403 family protein n=1 Tax=Alterisphingorhabdus coralli TaxID=3071408 RepID=A0AA97F6A1_9SPHN|nr:DUF4403 family protein [Parasphingorhabdus sp. SCSIO 66989]WOE73887.1 DUF4403 family protein [Parasphingorhabdus sp. SCSIO 66989]